MKTRWALAGAAFMAVAGLTGCKPEQDSALYDVSGVDRQFLISFDDMAVRTATGRTLCLSGQAYCETEALKHSTASAAYNAACRAIIGGKIAFVAAQENRLAAFETAIPLGNPAIRPYNVFDPAMLLRAVAAHHPQNLYTITDVADCATGTRTPLMTPGGRLPPEQWMGEAERKAPPRFKAAYGRIVGGACAFD